MHIERGRQVTLERGNGGRAPARYSTMPRCGFRGGVLVIALAGIGLVWWALDRWLRTRAQTLSRQRVVRVVKVAPALLGPYRSGGGGVLRIDETEAVLRRLRIGRRILGYALGTALVLLALALLLFTPLVGELDLFSWIGDVLIAGLDERRRG
jgi:hypothetical protein